MRRIFERQWLHVLLLVVLMGGLAAIRHTEGLFGGKFWRLDTNAWFLLAVGVAVAHQLFVWLCSRTQLHASLLTRTLGSAAFTVYAVVFSLLGIARIVSVFLLAIAFYTSNGMYVFGFFLIWFPGLWYASLAALAAALFSHLYIWVHYYCTERPDMLRIYGDVGST